MYKRCGIHSHFMSSVWGDTIELGPHFYKKKRHFNGDLIRSVLLFTSIVLHNVWCANESAYLTEIMKNRFPKTLKITISCGSLAM
jgi:hypothetical protein